MPSLEGNAFVLPPAFNTRGRDSERYRDDLPGFAFTRAIVPCTEGAVRQPQDTARQVLGRGVFGHAM